MSSLKNSINFLAKADYLKNVEDLTNHQLHNCVSKAVMAQISDKFVKSAQAHNKKRRAYYFSAEFLVGRAIYNNLLCTGALDENADLIRFEEIEDAALGNGGLGRLAACFLDSGATLGLALDGYGIRYKFGLFKQYFEDGFQKETLDYWAKFGDPWSVRNEEDALIIAFGKNRVKAVPYDMPIIGYGAKHISNLRLWQAEPITQFDFSQFDSGNYEKAVSDKNFAENISRVLYPNDNTEKGKFLRLMQQYFFCSASLQDIIKKFKQNHSELKDLPKYVTIQLNDTHPAISIPELIRLLMNESLSFNASLEIAKKVFNYTNHTILPEALEKWDLKYIRKISPKLVSIMNKINEKFKNESGLSIIEDATVNMAYLACYCSQYINGVAEIHTEILKHSVLKEFYNIYPQKFQNKTNGITQRRWLALCNRGLSSLITELLGNDDWITDLGQLKKLEKYADDKSVLEKFIDIKRQNKRKFADYIFLKEGKILNTDTIIDAQIKRLHEYKRQLLNILCILELYFEIKEGSLKNFTPTTFVFGAKSAPGYKRAKGIIKFINEVANLIENDEQVNKYIKVIFVTDYNVSYAEKIVAAADVSEQISTAGTEASGTGNMKLMLNGAVTLGTYDGANIEIVKEAGVENNYIFGAKVEDIEKIKDSYNPFEIYNNDHRIKRCLDTLVDGTFSDGGTGIFKELFDSLLQGAYWHQPDHYYLLLDFDDCLKTKIKVNSEYTNRYEFAKKQWLNMCNAGKFSSDRTIKEYAKDIWKIK